MCRSVPHSLFLWEVIRFLTLWRHKGTPPGTVMIAFNRRKKNSAILNMRYNIKGHVSRLPPMTTSLTGFQQQLDPNMRLRVTKCNPAIRHNFALTYGRDSAQLDQGDHERRWRARGVDSVSMKVCASEWACDRAGHTKALLHHSSGRDESINRESNSIAGNAGKLSG